MRRRYRPLAINAVEKTADFCESAMRGDQTSRRRIDTISSGTTSP